MNSTTQILWVKELETQQTFIETSSIDKKPSRLVFEQLVNGTIDNVLSYLGNTCKEAIYDYIERKYELKRDEIADHISEFSDVLERIFGSAAALLEIEMMRELYQKVSRFKHSPDGTLTFPDYVNALDSFFCRQDSAAESPVLK